MLLDHVAARPLRTTRLSCSSRHVRPHLRAEQLGTRTTRFPTAATGADPGVERRRKEREQRVATLNAQVTPLLATVRNSKTAAEYDEAVTKLTVWIIGTGPPAPVNTEGGLGVFAGSLPDGFRTRALVATCKETLDSLPRYYQKAGEYVYGARVCAVARQRLASRRPGGRVGVQIDAARAKSRAARQYETPTARWPSERR